MPRADYAAGHPERAGRCWGTGAPVGQGAWAHPWGRVCGRTRGAGGTGAPLGQGAHARRGAGGAAVLTNEQDDEGGTQARGHGRAVGRGGRGGEGGEAGRGTGGRGRTNEHDDEGGAEHSQALSPALVLSLLLHCDTDDDGDLRTHACTCALALRCGAWGRCLAMARTHACEGVGSVTAGRATAGRLTARGAWRPGGWWPGTQGAHARPYSPYSTRHSTRHVWGGGPPQCV